MTDRLYRRPTGAAARAAMLVAASVALAAAPLGAQTRFAWPDTAVDLGRYATIEECAAATARAERDDDRRLAAQRRDTLPWRPDEATRPPSPGLAETARRCAVRWLGATAPAEDYRFNIPLFLAAGRDADAAAVASRRLASLRPAWNAPGGARVADSAQAHAEGERGAIVDTIFALYMKAKPARAAQAESLVVTLRRSLARPYRATSVARLLEMYSRLIGAAQDVGDAAGERHQARQMLQLIDSLPAAERALLEERFESAQRLAAVMFGARYVAEGRRVAIDSLRKGTAAYLGYLLALWKQTTDEATVPVDIAIGRPAPRIVGVVHGVPDAARRDRPVPGRVNLVVLVDDMCSDLRPGLSRDLPSNCDEVAAMLRRLAAAQPDLEITLLDQSLGYVADVVTVDHALETTERARALAAHKVPGALVVDTTPFVRIAAPDGRRKDDMMAATNVKAYAFGGIVGMASGTAWLIDRNGIILRAEGLSRQLESEWAEMIAILIGHQTASR